MDHAVVAQSDGLRLTCILLLSPKQLHGHMHLAPGHRTGLPTSPTCYPISACARTFSGKLLNLWTCHALPQRCRGALLLMPASRLDETRSGRLKQELFKFGVLLPALGTFRREGAQNDQSKWQHQKKMKLFALPLQPKPPDKVRYPRNRNTFDGSSPEEQGHCAAHAISLHQSCTRTSKSKSCHLLRSDWRGPSITPTQVSAIPA